MKLRFAVIFTNIILIQSLFSQKVPESKLIWDKAPHNAFTDIIRFDHYFYCVFREGKGHKPIRDYGKIRVLRSKNGKRWNSVAFFEISDFDLRDPKLSVTPDNRLMVLMGGTKIYNKRKTGGISYVSFSKNGLEFSDPVPVVFENNIKSNFDWVWRVTWHNKFGYGVLYQDPKLNLDFKTKLVKTTDGINYYVVCDIDLKGRPNEATIRFGKVNEMFVLVRRNNALGILGQSLPPYNHFQWTTLKFRLGGPNLEILGDQLFVVGTRVYDTHPRGKNHHTTLFLIGTDEKIKSTIELKSYGDTGYPGFLLYHRKLWVSYYSSHEGKTSIYLSKIKLRNLVSSNKPDRVN